jgi:hypothetical protein
MLWPGGLFCGNGYYLAAINFRGLGSVTSEHRVEGESAQELRSQTTMPLAWIAQRLRLGSRGYLTWLLQRRGESSFGGKPGI